MQQATRRSLQKYTSSRMLIVSEIGRDLSQSYNKKPYTHRKIQKATSQHKNATKPSITQRFRNDFGRSVGVSTAIQLMWLNRFTEFKPSHSPQKLCNQKYTHLQICKPNRESTEGCSKLIVRKNLQVREKDWSQQVEHMQVPNGTGPGVRRSKRPL